jgi:hypothetical protein
MLFIIFVDYLLKKKIDRKNCFSVLPLPFE